MTLAPGETVFPVTGPERVGGIRSSNPQVVSVTLDGAEMRAFAYAPGFASVRIEDALGETLAQFGVAVTDESGDMPGLPPYLAVGSMSEDTPTHLAFFRHFGAGDRNRRVDIRYIYLNGGPYNGWRTWSNTPGDRVGRYIRESKQLGMMPFFVWYNVPSGGESYWTNKQHLADPDYMVAYYRDLALMMREIRRETSDGWPVGIVIEPDLIGYMAQNAVESQFTSSAGGIEARVDAAYEALDFDGASILEAGVDPAFPNTLRGFVESVNYLLQRDVPDALVGWQVNLWASPPGGYTGAPIPGTGVIHLTDSMGLVPGRELIRDEATAITEYYLNAGVATQGADFLAIDKYGLDAVGVQAFAASDPARSTWFWNADHWRNYLAFVGAMSERSDLPSVLWQIPVGHVNNSLSVNPYSQDGYFTPLSNTHQRYEDSAGTFFFGDNFAAQGARASFFAANESGSSKISVGEDGIEWGAHMEETAQAGVVAVLFGAGVGSSTQGTPPSSPDTDAAPTDDHWWIVQAQRYLDDPVILQATAGPSGSEAPSPPPTQPEVASDPANDSAPGPDAATDVALRVDSLWHNGYTAAFVLTNRTEHALASWTFCFEAGPAYSQVWNATAPGPLCVEAPGWAPPLAPGAAAEFGFTAVGVVPATIEGATLNGLPVAVAVSP